MQFYEVNTNYVNCKHIMKEQRRTMKYGEMEWYDKMLGDGIAGDFIRSRENPDRDGNALLALDCERIWYLYGKPYYKVYPAIASMMSEISIDIPVNELKLPYPSFSIQLANDPSNDFVEANGPRLRWLMVYEVNLDVINERQFKFNPKTGQRQENVKLKSGFKKALWINYMFDGLWRGEPNAFNYVLSLDQEVGTLEDFFKRSWNESQHVLDDLLYKGEYNPSRDMVTRIIKLAVATAFFGIDRHEFVMPDLPRRKIESKIRQYGGEAVKKIKEERKATKRWTIGREIELPLPIIEQRRREKEGEGRSMTHAYAKRGHMRWQACGEGKKLRKLIFIHPHVCRSDLPFSEFKGFKITNPNK